ncbi:DUF1330 domain-containing protein [Saccharophagus degradans]|uniref:DUF1330 domain-containing protein n=1 Tax=Saccharophagus degradans TaxID=86304 RepID=UPI001C082B9E|nr:DUF1330 domain-containing protein [Saccharophagus degradans]MBU2986530.1 DUF1330 domain-containing protein [Saccharophagus degradans]
MTAYAIGLLTIHNDNWLEEYSSKILPLIEKHGGNRLVKGTPERLEGTSNLPTIAFCIAFPSSAAAHNWYNDPENKPLITLRNSGSTLDMLLVENPT